MVGRLASGQEGGARRNKLMGQVNVNPGDGGGSAAAIVLVVVVLLVLVILVRSLTGFFNTRTTSEPFQLLAVSAKNEHDKRAAGIPLTALCWWVDAVGQRRWQKG